MPVDTFATFEIKYEENSILITATKRLDVSKLQVPGVPGVMTVPGLYLETMRSQWLSQDPISLTSVYRRIMTEELNLHSTPAKSMESSKYEEPWTRHDVWFNIKLKVAGSSIRERGIEVELDNDLMPYAEDYAQACGISSFQVAYQNKSGSTELLKTNDTLRLIQNDVC